MNDGDCRISEDKCSLVTIFGWLFHGKGRELKSKLRMLTESGVLNFKKSFIRYCLENLICNPINLGQALYHCATLLSRNTRSYTVFLDIGKTGFIWAINNKQIHNSPVSNPIEHIPSKSARHPVIVGSDFCSRGNSTTMRPKFEGQQGVKGSSRSPNLPTPLLSHCYMFYIV